MKRLLPVCAAVLVACASVGDADAASILRTFYQNGGSACTGALPTFEGALRKRPKAIANEGATTAFVTCSAMGNDRNTAKPAGAFVYVTNRSATTVELSCTLVNGDEFYGSIATSRTATLPVNMLTSLFWGPVAPATELPRDTINVSCALPPGVEINTFGQTIEEDIGN